ncbi:MAG: hypothetical protein AAF670_18490 [Planctomycetota bacterium]
MTASFELSGDDASQLPATPPVITHTHPDCNSHSERQLDVVQMMPPMCPSPMAPAYGLEPMAVFKPSNWWQHFRTAMTMIWGRSSKSPRRAVGPITVPDRALGPRG